ncbi:hypothetical protein O3G_MSEX003941 [Manduca sexta]|uniref:Uncharacterized protein n=1 Tax=Manduca sexta TaxID=7130 RepID=A0A921YVG0_MANSE|nr:hypothetical protein O3G_MSEX003941 [Manduca sexta]KAG6445494.1 hypothetical protein O3G_MSEX003941 [Manduca sexta]
MTDICYNNIFAFLLQFNFLYEINFPKPGPFIILCLNFERYTNQTGHKDPQYFQGTCHQLKPQELKIFLHELVRRIRATRTYTLVPQNGTLRNKGGSYSSLGTNVMHF